jgi:peptidoglycan-associated lipoprotein
MSELRKLRNRKVAGALLALMVLTAASGCKKKVPPPPPPPPPPVTRNDTAPPPSSGKPTINSFSAEPSRIEKGQASTLRWSISNATDMTLDQNLGAVQSQGSRQVYPSASTTYTLIANGPGGSDTRTVTVEVSSASAPPPPTVQPTLSTAEMLSREGQDAYFDYDKYDLRPDARQALTVDADLLKRIFLRDSNLAILVEGHSDERGSAEYNIALSDRRATAAKEFLVQLGIPAERLKTISYGKERPQCTDATEDCYQKNRRAHLAAGQ